MAKRTILVCCDVKDCRLSARSRIRSPDSSAREYLCSKHNINKPKCVCVICSKYRKITQKELDKCPVNKNN